MNRLRLLLLLLTAGCCSCQHPIDFEVSGMVEGIHGDTVFLTSIDRPRSFFDTCIIEHGKFELSGQVPDEGFYYIQFSGTTDHIEGVSEEITGPNPKWSSLKEIYIQPHAHYYLTSKGGMEGIFGANETIETDSYQTNLYRAYNQRYRQAAKQPSKSLDNDSSKNKLSLKGSLLKEYIDKGKNLDALFVPLEISFLPDMQRNYKYYELVLNRLDPKIRSNKYFRIATQKVNEARQQMENPHDFPIITPKNLIREEFDLKQFENKNFIVIDLWASWCVACLEDIPYVVKFQEELNARNIQYVFMSWDSRYQQFEATSRRLELGNFNYFLDNESKRKLNEYYGINVIPRYLIIDPRTKKVLSASFDPPSDPNFIQKIDEILKNKKLS